MNDTEYLLDEYDSDEDGQGGRKPTQRNSDYGNISKDVLDLLKRYKSSRAFYIRVIIAELVLI